MNAIKDILAKAELLPDNDLLVVSYELPNVLGKIQIGNNIKLLPHKSLDELRVVLRFIEKHSIGFYIIPKQNSKP